MEILILQAMMLVSVIGLFFFLLENTKLIAWVSKKLFGAEELQREPDELEWLTKEWKPKNIKHYKG